MRLIKLGLGVFVLALGLWAMASRASAQEVNVYSSRHYAGDKIVFERFTKQTGIKINVIEGSIGPLLQRMEAEGRNSPADLLITVDAGNLWRAQQADLLQPVQSKELESVIPAKLREPTGLWFGLSQRARVIVYNKNKVKPSDLSTYESLADPKWKGRILIRSSSNIYNQSLLASIIAADGPEKAEAWARGLVANFARPPKGGDTDQIKAVAAGEGDIAISNTYYFARLQSSSKPEDKAVVENLGIFFPNQNGRGTHVNISGAGVAKHAPHRENAIKLLEFLVSPESQKDFAQGNYEYPVRAGVPRAPAVMEWGSFKADSVNAVVLGRNNAEAVKIADRAGWR
jgi:iron(III) transport system substrate-binding protein